MTGIAITGPQSPASTAIPQTKCHPASILPNGSNYNIALIESQTVTSEDVSSDLAPFFYSITPILSIFYDPSGSSSSSLPEAHLSCVKVVEDSHLVQVASSGAAMVGVAKGIMVLALVAVVGWVGLV